MKPGLGGQVVRSGLGAGCEARAGGQVVGPGLGAGCGAGAGSWELFEEQHYNNNSCSNTRPNYPAQLLL